MPEGLSISHITKTFGDFKAIDDISFESKKGEFVTLLGPSGCGKTTLLRMIAGFIEPDKGQISFNGKILNDIPPSKRNTAMCFQSYALFPHKSVYENIRFGLKMKKIPENIQRERIEEVMKMVNLTGLGKRKPYELSGGQQQRVALARAVVVQPDILLFDEPLSNLDAKLREKVRVEIRELQRMLKTTAIYVTHDQAEALAISDKIISMNQGRIIQATDPKTIYDQPRTKFVADFIGVANILPGTVIEHRGEYTDIETAAGVFTAKLSQELNGKVDICWRPEDMIPNTSTNENCNILKGKTKNTVYMGNMLDIFFECGDHVFRANVTKDNWLDEGIDLEFAIPYDHIHVMEGERDA